MNKQKQCKGCNINEDSSCILLPNIKASISNHECPCQVCLIKSVCKNYCEEFKQYSTDFYDNIKKNALSYHKYVQKLKLSQNSMNCFNMLYMRGVPMVLKYQDVRNVRGVNNELNVDKDSPGCI